MFGKIKSILLEKLKAVVLENKIFYGLACFFYFLNSFSNVSQGVLTKFFTKSAESFTFYQFMSIRCFVGAFLLIPFLLKSLSPSVFQGRAFAINILIATLSALDIILWNTGLKTVPVNNGILIAFLVPIWSIILARILLKEKDFSIFHLISFILCFIAIFILVKKDLNFDTFNIGYLFIFLNTINIPLSLILQKKWGQNRPMAYGIFSNLLIGGLICFALADFALPKIDKNIIFSAGVIAFFDILEYFSVYIAYKLHPIASLQPIRFTRIIISTVFSYLFLNEKLTLMQFVVILIIVSANILIPIGKRISKSN